MKKDDAEILKAMAGVLRFRGFFDLLNFDDPVRPHPCTECPMMEFVPLQFQAKIAPCRFAFLAENVETVDHFSRSGTQMEVEGALACWLCKRIGWQNIRETLTDREREIGRLNWAGS